MSQAQVSSPVVSVVTTVSSPASLRSAAGAVDAELVDVNRVIDEMHAINAAAVPAVGAASEDHLRYLIEASMFTLVVSSRHAGGSETVGFCIVMAPGSGYASLNYRWFSDRYVDFIYLDRVAIVPEQQGRGVGGALYRTVERLAAELRPTATTFGLEVNVRPRNDQSLAFHARQGFEEVGQRQADDDTIVSLMTAPLPRPASSLGT